MSKPIGRLNKTEKLALEYFNLEYAKSDEPGAGWFAYTDMFNPHQMYPGSSCECLGDVVRWYVAATSNNVDAPVSFAHGACGKGY